MAHDAGYLLGMAIGFAVVPYFVLYLVYLLVTRRMIRIPLLLGGLVAAAGLTFLLFLAAGAWLGEDLAKTPVPMFGGVIIAGAVISLLGRWKGLPTQHGE
ncbi:hypothetical protein AN478_06810 [Thiohalorhabdus denitrificans]|uniref:Uncharacterized protein n=1 Tax=Thiohalorhabdus denitrificans TaxID=381306 RepID=A0A0P9EDS5_9GAMM|nr:hypothetical protein [Thiohalorhabdus denitrificans]KPV40489.1 hypothetical protein AN478_06810 [Thiohalorhabdus denitrificans]SCY62202.1 hypothetical protein SAMN05661077_2725 [Thiohalorhabdus denitrificans]